MADRKGPMCFFVPRRRGTSADVLSGANGRVALVALPSQSLQHSQAHNAEDDHGHGDILAPLEALP